MPITLLKFPHDDIVFENYEDEMVLLNLPEGVYFTLDSVGADCLLTLLSAPRADAAIDAIRQRYTSPPEQIHAGIARLVELLTAAGIAVVRADGEPGIDVATAATAAVSAYSPPRLDRYEDIEDILKFDPVHEVAETGWPNIQADAPGKP